MSMKMGIYLNSQHPVADNASQRFAEIVEQVKLCEQVGFDSVWAGEHHLTPGFHFFPQLTLLSALTGYTGDMMLGTNLVLLPLHRPVDLAEQVALIDIACGGQFIMTVGQGYRPEEFAAMGSPFEDRLERFVDGIEVMRRLWGEGPVTHDAGWWSVEDETVLPQPQQAGGPPIWVGATSDRAIKRGGRIGDAFMATPSVDNDEVKRQADLFAAARSEADLPPAPDLGRLIEVHCHQDGDEARRRCGPHLLTKYAAYAAWGLTGSAGSGAADAASGNDEDAFAALAENRFVVGDPDEVVAGLVHQHRELGMTHLAMRLSWPGSDPTHTTECIELLGTEVLPRVRAELSS